APCDDPYLHAHPTRRSSDLILGSDAGPLVAHGEEDLGALALGVQYDPPARRRELDRVAEEVPEHLDDPIAIAAHDDSVDREIQLERDALLSRGEIGRAHV